MASSLKGGIVTVTITIDFNEIERKLTIMQGDIAALKALAEEKFGVISTALTNIGEDIAKLQGSSSLSQEDKDALASIGTKLGELADAAQAAANLEP